MDAIPTENATTLTPQAGGQTWQQEAARILDFWFLPAGHGQARAQWFRKDADFDAVIASQFGALIHAALAQQLPPWRPEQPASWGLAQIILLDQFTRNTGRGTPQAFAGDAQALATSLAMLASGADQQLTPLQRWFVYMPLEHAEDLALQQRCVALFAALAAQEPSLAGAHQYAIAHHDVIARFGRFPHRNAILGRTSSAEESAFLSQPGSHF